MDLRQCIAFIKDREKELCLINTDSGAPIEQELATYFSAQNVRITSGATATGAPAEIAVLSSSDTVLTVVSVATLRELMDRVPSGTGATGIADSGYADILAHLKETTFTSYDTEQLLYASREIEDRARRVGQGAIHAGFQYVSTMQAQESLYTDLASRGLSVHAYGYPDAALPDFGSGQIHTSTADEITEMWFVVFDGGGDDTQQTALVAHEQAPDEFYGAWTYDTTIVNALCAYLQQTYLQIATG